MNVGSLKVFDKAALMAYGAAGPYGRAPAVPMVVTRPERLVLTSFLTTFLPSAKINVIKILMAFNQNIFVQK
jgi:hypothetical protein